MDSIPLTHGYVTIIDDQDIDLKQFKWLSRNRYASRSVGTRKSRRHVLLHRVILERVLCRELNKGETVDHIDGDTLNNCRSNLRLATIAQNGRNKNRSKANTSGYKGVSRYNGAKKNCYRAYIRIDGRQIHLGYFETAELAYQAYCEASKVYHGEFGRLA